MHCTMICPSVQKLITICFEQDDDEKHSYQPFGFGYDIEDGHGNKQWRHEKSHQPWHVEGSYGYKGEMLLHFFLYCNES